MLCANTLHTSADGACPERRRRDWRSLPAQTIVGASTLQYAYDGDGNRVKKQVVGGTKDYYVRGVDGQTLALYDGYGALQFFNILAGSEVIGTWDGTQRRYFLKDHLGSVRTTVDQSGNVDGYDDYYPFGLVMPGRSSNSANPNDKYKFTGHERDDEAGLNIDYMMARNYDPVIARFMQIDPLADIFPGWTPYHYTHNNPVNMIDPTGMAACDDGSKVCEWWNNLMAVVDEVLKNAQVNITFNFGEDGEVTATSEVSQEQTMMANAMLQDLKDQGEKVGGIYEAIGEIPGGDVAQELYEGNYGQAALDAGMYTIPGGKLGKKALPALDATGKVHGILPKIEDLGRYSKDELVILYQQLKQSVQQRIRVTSRMGRDRAHGQRQGAEQNLMKAIEKHLQDR